MGVQAVQLVSRALNYSFELFTTFLDKTGLTPFYLSMVAIMLVVAYLLSPFLVPAGSDRALSDEVRKRNTTAQLTASNAKAGKYLDNDKY